MIEEDQQKFTELLNESEDIRKKLEEEISISGKSELYTDLNKFIMRVSHYIFRDKEKKFGKECMRLWAEKSATGIGKAS